MVIRLIAIKIYEIAESGNTGNGGIGEIGRRYVGALPVRGPRFEVGADTSTAIASRFNPNFKPTSYF